MVRMLSPAKIGIWILFTSVVSFLELVRAGFIRNPFLVVFVNATDETKKDVLAASVLLHILTVTLTSSLLVIFASSLGAFWDSPELAGLLYLYAFNSFVLIPFFHFEFIMQAKIKYKGIFYSNLLRLGIMTPCLIFFFTTKQVPPLIVLVWIQLLSSVAALFLSYSFIRRFCLPLLPIELKKKQMVELLNLGKYTFGTVISSSFFRNADSWMIGKLMSNYMVALYNPAIRIANLVDVPSVSIVTLVFPRVTELMKERGPEGIREIYSKSVGLILAIIAPVCALVYLFAGTLVEVIFGLQYMAAVPVLRVTVFYMLMLPFVQQFGAVMDAIKRPRINFFFLLGSAIINLVLNYYFILEYGIIGAAYGTFYSYIILLSFSQFYLYRNFRVSPLTVLAFVFFWYRTGYSEILKTIMRKRKY